MRGEEGSLGSSKAHFHRGRIVHDSDYLWSYEEILVRCGDRPTQTQCGIRIWVTTTIGCCYHHVACQYVIVLPICGVVALALLE